MTDHDRDKLMTDVLTATGVTVAQLQPGDVVNLGPHSAVFITQTQHPMWPHLRLVVWRTSETLDLPGNWSHDALDARQVVGTVMPATPAEREVRLRSALRSRTR